MLDEENVIIEPVEITEGFEPEVVKTPEEIEEETVVDEAEVLETEEVE